MKLQCILCFVFLMMSSGFVFAGEESVSLECIKALVNDPLKEVIKISDGTYLIKDAGGGMSILGADKTMEVTKNLDCKMVSKGGWKDLAANGIHLKNNRSKNRPTELRDYNNPQLLKACYPDVYKKLRDASGVVQ